MNLKKADLFEEKNEEVMDTSQKLTHNKGKLVVAPTTKIGY